MNRSLRYVTSRLMALALGLQAMSCVSPPIGRGPSADVRLEGLLSGADTLQGEELARGLRALSLDHPRHVPTLVADAALSLETGRVDRASALLDSALGIAPDHGDGVLLATKIAAKSGDLASGRRRVTTALQTRPDAPELHEASAALFYLEKQYGEAQLALNRADALAGEASWRSFYHRGLLEEAQNNLDEALRQFLRCEASAPSFEPATRRRRWIEAQMAAPPSLAPGTGTTR